MPEIISIDIETKPLPDKVREYNTFDPSSVKMLKKDAGKEKEKIATEEKDFWEKLDDRAALHAHTAQIVAVGLIDDDSGAQTHFIGHTNDEADLISKIWDTYKNLLNGNLRHHNITGWNIEGFDLPMLIQRSRIIGLQVPAAIMNGRYFNSTFMDLMKIWTCYQYGQYAKLETVAKILGVARERKHKIHGKDFWKHLENDTDNAIRYLEDDLIETQKIGNILINH